MKRKVLGLVLLVISILGVSLGGSTLFAQYYVPPYDPFREQNSELAKIDQATQDLAAQLRGKHDAAKEAELKKLVEELFAKRHAAQVAEAKALADKLAKLQDLLKKREEKKAEIVARRVKQLLGETDDLDWNPNARQENLNLIPSYGFSPDGRSLGVLEVPRKSKETPNKPEPIPGLPMMAPSPDSDPLATWVGQGQRSGVANLMANQKNLAADLKTLEIEVQLAKNATQGSRNSAGALHQG